MDADASAGAVEYHLDMMDRVAVHDEPTAHAALSHALAAIGGMNQGLAAGQQEARSLAEPAAGIAGKLEDWIKRLLDKLTEIVKALAKGTSFSLSVGTAVSVTINFPPMGQA